ncbi:hypothetical protein [Nonomuraea recticatena]
MWKAVERNPEVTFTVVGDYAFVPGPGALLRGRPVHLPGARHR